MQLFQYPPTPASTLPAGAATAANQLLILAALKPQGLDPRKLDDLTPVTNLAYTNVGAVTVGDAIRAHIMMTNGEPLYLSIDGGATDAMIICPGGNGFVEIQVPAGSQLAVKCVYPPVAISGFLLISLFGEP